MKASALNSKERKYFIDWLRIGLIISVFLFHVGMIFRPEHWHVNSTESFAFLDPIMWWLHLWRMPLLFLVSGVGTYYALGFRTSWQYVKERITRLYIPLSFGFFTLVPVMIYYERIDLYTSLLDYYPHMFDGGPYPQGNISWHHLWFIVYLLVISLLISPFIRYTKSGHYNMVRAKLITLTSGKMKMNWVLPVLILSQWILRHYYPYSTHALFDDWAYFCYYLIYFLIGFVLITSKKIIESLQRDRRLYAIQTAFFTLLLFTLPKLITQPSEILSFIMSVIEIIIALSCGYTVLGYFRTYCNKDHKSRKLLNEAIYPFYLLHQPALIVIGYYVLKWDISYGMQAFLITVLSLIASIGLYWFVIKRWRILRLLFGLKVKFKSSKPQKEQELNLALEQ